MSLFCAIDFYYFDFQIPLKMLIVCLQTLVSNKYIVCALLTLSPLGQHWKFYSHAVWSRRKHNFKVYFFIKTYFFQRQFIWDTRSTNIILHTFHFLSSSLDLCSLRVDIQKWATSFISICSYKMGLAWEMFILWNKIN